MLWYLGPSALLLGVAAFVIILLMSVFGAGSVLVWFRRGRRAGGVRRDGAPRTPGIGDAGVRKQG